MWSKREHNASDPLTYREMDCKPCTLRVHCAKCCGPTWSGLNQLELPETGTSYRIKQHHVVNMMIMLFPHDVDLNAIQYQHQVGEDADVKQNSISIGVDACIEKTLVAGTEKKAEELNMESEVDGKDYFDQVRHRADAAGPELPVEPQVGNSRLLLPTKSMLLQSNLSRMTALCLALCLALCFKQPSWLLVLTER